MKRFDRKPIQESKEHRESVGEMVTTGSLTFARINTALKRGVNETV
jgi:hypothetical protein